MITAISLSKIGDEFVVAIEVYGEWVPVIVEDGDFISHIVEERGIKRCIASPRRGRSRIEWEEVGDGD